MIQIERKDRNGLPVLEVVDAANAKKKVPIVVFWHGFTQRKEISLIPGYEIAKRGMRAILPDAFLHGDRSEEDYSGDSTMRFWNIVTKSVNELPSLLEPYRALELVDEVFVSGLSMGAVTTCMALTQNDWITGAACLMGSPDPIAFSKWLASSHWLEGQPKLDEEKIEKSLQPILPFSLAAHPEKVAGRPFYSWHGTKDNSMPIEQIEAFYNKHHEESYGQKMMFEKTEGVGHKVPFEVFVRMAAFFEDRSNEAGSENNE